MYKVERRVIEEGPYGDTMMVSALCVLSAFLASALCFGVQSTCLLSCLVGCLCVKWATARPWTLFLLSPVAVCYVSSYQPLKGLCRRQTCGQCSRCFCGAPHSAHRPVSTYSAERATLYTQPTFQIRCGRSLSLLTYHAGPFPVQPSIHPLPRRLAPLCPTPPWPRS